MSFDAEVTPTTDLLRLHVDHCGRVWYGSDGFLAEDSGRCVRGFFAEPAIDLHRARQVRVLGIRENAELILRLHETYAKTVHRQQPSVYLGSRTLVPEQLHVDPESVLARLWQTGLHMVGDWHRLTSGDYTTYALVQTLLESDNQVNDKARKIFRYHPSYPAFSFLPRFNTDAAIRLVTQIVDPRWFVNSRRPNRINRLLHFVGVLPENAMATICSMKPDGHNAARWELLTATWYDTVYQASMTNPRSFLLRIFKSTHEPATGLLRACRKFLRFIHEVWLHESSSALHTECAFMPERFFKDDLECQAYKQHRQLLTGGKK